MIKFSSFLKRTFNHVKRHVYFWTGTVFTVWVLFFDQHNVYGWLSDLLSSNRQEKEKEMYIEKIRSYSKMLEELQSNDDNLVKFAREQYYMKADDEDVYIVIERD